MEMEMEAGEEGEGDGGRILFRYKRNINLRN